MRVWSRVEHKNIRSKIWARMYGACTNKRGYFSFRHSRGESEWTFNNGSLTNANICLTYRLTAPNCHWKHIPGQNRINSSIDVSSSMYVFSVDRENHIHRQQNPMGWGIFFNRH